MFEWCNKQVKCFCECKVEVCRVGIIPKACTLVDFTKLCGVLQHLIQPQLNSFNLCTNNVTLDYKQRAGLFSRIFGPQHWPDQTYRKLTNEAYSGHIIVQYHLYLKPNRMYHRLLVARPGIDWICLRWRITCTHTQWTVCYLHTVRCYQVDFNIYYKGVGAGD